MTTRTPPLPWHPDSLLPPARDASDRPLLWSALAAAGLLHLGALCLPLPPPAEVELPEMPRGPTINLTELVIPPPSLPELDLPPPGRFVRRLPVPAPEFAIVEPLREPARTPLSDLAPGDPPPWVGARPTAPPPLSGPVDERTPGVELPVALAGRLQPAYPEGARRFGLEGLVVLRALITESGDVESIEVVRETRPGLGFGAAAVEAVSTWKYRPGRLDGRPVAVMLTVVVDFRLH
jgi:protein TonB